MIPAAKPTLYLLRLLCAAYWALLTVMLLLPDPLGWLGIHRLPGGAGGMGVHFTCFAILGGLVAASRLPLRTAALAAWLLGFASAVELAQLLVPERTVELKDAAENVLGLGAGAALWRFIQRRVARKRQDSD